jgi:hypothetical protein
MLISSSKSGDRMCPVSIALGKGKPLGCNGEKCALLGGPILQIMRGMLIEINGGRI